MTVPFGTSDEEIEKAVKEAVVIEFTDSEGNTLDDVDFEYVIEVKDTDEEGTTYSVHAVLTEEAAKTYTINKVTYGYVKVIVEKQLTKTAAITKSIAKDSQVALNWSEVEGAQKYAIYLWSKSGGVKCVGTRDSGVTGAYIKGLTNGTKYGFLVRTYNGEKWSDYEASDWVYAVPFSIPKPSITKCIGQTGRAALNWSAVNGAEQYAVYTYINGVYTCVGSRAAGVTGMYVKNLESGKRYGFLVRAKINGQWSSYTTADIAYADIL